MSRAANPSLFVVGVVGRVYFQGRGIPIVEEFSHVVQNPTMRRAREIGDEVVRRFLDRSLDEVHILYTEMVSPLKLELRERTLLPLAMQVHHGVTDGFHVGRFFNRLQAWADSAPEMGA